VTEVATVGALTLVVLVAPRFLRGPAVLVALVVTPVVEAASGAYDNGLTSRKLLLVLAAFGTVLSASALRERLRRRPERSIAEPDVPRPRGELRNLLTTEVARARRSRRPLSVLLIEAAGGERTISFETYRGPIEAQLRAIDLVARINGTVGVLLPYTSELDGRTVAERIRLSVPPQLRSDVTLSIGIAEFPRDSTRADELLELAERALSHAKERGGNRTICTSLDPGAPPGWTLTRELSPS
jgi:hypothetical protein